MIKTLKLTSADFVNLNLMTPIASNATKVLIVEDELIVAENLAKHLTQQGYLVLDIVDSGSEAIAVSQQQSPDVVLMDITLQGEIDGIAAAREISGRHHQPVIYMTAHADDATLERAKSTGPYGYLVKPFNPSNLKATIEIALEKYRLDTHQQTFQIQQLTTAQQRIQELQYRDPLTQLLSSTGLQEQFQKQIAMLAAAEATVPIAMMPLLYLRLDAFERLRSYGLGIAQQAIVQVARRVEQVLSGDGIAARIDTCEFAILLMPVTSKVQVAQVAQQLLLAIAEPLICDRQEIFISATIGGSLYPHHSANFNGLLTYAQSPINRLQARGGNSYQLYSEVLDALPSKRQLSLESSLYYALERQELYLVYQPQLDFKTGNVIGVEALLRWQHPTLGNISPNEFIPIAESTGLIQSIGEWVITAACKQLHEWHARGWKWLRVAVNLSGLQLQNPSLRPCISRCLLENQLPPSALELELTESILVEDTAVTKRAIRSLKTLGVNIAIDDFGTGYSSLQYIQQIPVDTLKLDRTFIQNVHHPAAKNAEIVKAVIQMAHALQMTVIAEGISTEGERDFLRENAADIAQGYLSSPPLSAQEFSTWLEARQQRSR